ncbi:helix-turn-helix domain-containing protein [Flavobacterium sp.]|uniref:helix-turn-helix domain-containing protein n=1 Tax=Flavobacterium sp. TaxID=239 RepID=UPI003D6B9825
MNDTITITDSEKINKVLEALDLTIHSFTKKLKYSSSTIYHVINGKNKLSPSMIERIMITFPVVSYRFLKEGEGEVLLDESQKKNQMNMFNILDEKHDNVDSAIMLEKLNTLIMLQQRGNELQVQTNELLKELLETKKAV